MMKFLLLLNALAWTLLAHATPVLSQAASGSSAQAIDADPKNGRESPLVFTATTHLVVLDMAARDEEDNPIRDLTENDFQVFEQLPGSKKVLQKLSSFRIVDGSAAQKLGQVGGLLLDSPLHVTTCTSRWSVFYYELSYYPSAEIRK